MAPKISTMDSDTDKDHSALAVLDSDQQIEPVNCTVPV